MGKVQNDKPEMPCEKQADGVRIREKAMNVLVVYCHPSENSFTSEVKNSFVKGLEEAGHTYTISDLYAEGFNPVMSKEEYHREGFYKLDMTVCPDVIREQERMNSSDVSVFIYHVFWTASKGKREGWLKRGWR